MDAMSRSVATRIDVRTMVRLFPLAQLNRVHVEPQWALLNRVSWSTVADFHIVTSDSTDRIDRSPSGFRRVSHTIAAFSSSNALHPASHSVIIDPRYFAPNIDGSGLGLTSIMKNSRVASDLGVEQQLRNYVA